MIQSESQTVQAISILAAKIAAELFTNGNGDTADRLALVKVGNQHDLGGWSAHGATWQIRKILEADLASRAAPPSWQPMRAWGLARPQTHQNCNLSERPYCG